jgi:hypothetical protein
MLPFRTLQLPLAIASFALACSSEKLQTQQTEAGGKTSWLPEPPSATISVGSGSKPEPGSLAPSISASVVASTGTLLAVPSLSAPGESAVSAPIEPDAGPVLADVSYSVKMTNGIDCCDIYTMVKSDRQHNVCLFVELRQAVQSETKATSFRATVGADNCWDRLGDSAARKATSFDGKVYYAKDGTQPLMSVDVVAMFATDAQWTLPEAEVRALDLPIDGKWYPAK